MPALSTNVTRRIASLAWVAVGPGLAFMLIYRGRSTDRVIRPEMLAWINQTIVSAHTFV